MSNVDDEKKDEKNPHAVELGRKGGLKGGQARAESLTPAQRVAIARDAAAVRWAGKVPKETHEGTISIGPIEIRCAVLDNGMRVLSRADVGVAFGARKKLDNSPEPPPFLTAAGLQRFISPELKKKLEEPLSYKTKQGLGGFGYEASVLPEICEAIQEAKAAGVLRANQGKFADAAAILYKGLVRLGIIGLVDEATGYQYERARNELALILEQYIAKELMPWTKKFPDEFFRQIYKIYGWEYKEGSAKRPQNIGHFINKYVYDRLPPGVLNELREINPSEHGRRKHKHFQFLTDDTGNPHLDKQIVAVITILRLSDDKTEFADNFRKVYPRVGEQVPMKFPKEADE